MANRVEQVMVPNIGGATDVEVIEIGVKPGDQVAVEDSLITLEGDKATMDVPSPFAGTIKDVQVKVGDKVAEGSKIVTMEVAGEGDAPAPAKEEPKQAAPVKKEEPKAAPASVAAPASASAPSNGSVHAGPAVRRIAHELDIDLTRITGSGEKGRITKADLQRALSGGGSGLAVAPARSIDFSKFGEIEKQALSKIKKATGANLSRHWVTIPHVTQFGQADITELEAFRQEQKEYAAQQNVKLTPLVFIIKAVVAALKEFPQFNASLDSNGENLVIKKYFHIGVAVDTPNGLVVPVIRDADKKGLFELAKELGDMSEKARTKGLGLVDMQGGCFSISSLGGIGGTAFTPIINAPEVAILGVSRTSWQPVCSKDGVGGTRLMLPLSLSYDHRVIDGAEGARFTVYLAARLADIRTLLL